MQAIILSKEDIYKIISLYKDGYSSPKIASIFNYSAPYIRNVLRKNGVDLRKLYQINHTKIINDNFFNIIDSQEKAYFLGILFADGNVHSKYNAITLKLTNNDGEKELLNKLNELISKDNLIYYYDNDIVLKFSSYQIKNDLIRYGCIPNKSLKIEFPNNIDLIYYPHFIRGYFDGDGSIFRYRNDFVIAIVSTRMLCEKIKEIINDINIDGKIIHELKMLKSNNNITTTLIYKGNRRILKVLNWLYRDTTIYLSRKYKKYLELKQWCEFVDSKTSKYINY